MTPAMVDVRSPASASSKHPSNTHISKSSAADRIPSFPSQPMPRTGGIPDPPPPMDPWNLGKGVFVTSAESFPPPPSSFSIASEKLSVPRFRKQRKYSGTSRARPTVVPLDSGADQGFSPFGPQMSHVSPRDRVEDSRSQSVREQLFGWRPFVPDASSHSSSGTGLVFGGGSSGSISSSSNLVSESINGTAFDLDNNSRGKNGSGIFVFGSGIEKGSSLSRSSSQSSSAQSPISADSAKSEGTKTILDTGTSTYSNVESVGTGTPIGSSVPSFGADNVIFDTDEFVSATCAPKDGISLHNSFFSTDNNSLFKPNMKKSVNEKIAKMEPSFFAHKKGEKKNTQSSKSFSVTSDDSLLSEQTERIKKIDIENSSDADSKKVDWGVFLSESCSQKANLDQISSLHSDESPILASSKLSEELRKLKFEASQKGENVSKDPGVFTFGSGVNKSSLACESSSFGAFECSFSKIPERMEKLNLHSSSYAVHVDTTSAVFVTEGNLKNSQFSRSSSGVEEGGFFKFLGESTLQNLQSSGNEEHGNEKHGVFVFGSDVPEKATSDKSSFLSSDEKDPGVFKFGNGINKSSCTSNISPFDTFDSSFLKLPEKMVKLNLHSSSCPVRENTISENSSKNAPLSQTSSGHEDSGFSKFPGELKNQNLQRFCDKEHGNENPGDFIFGSDVQEKANFDKPSFLSFVENKDPDVCLFGSGLNRSNCPSKESPPDAFECSFSKLPEKMEKLNLRSSAVPEDTTSAFFVSGSSSKNAQFSQNSPGLDEGDISKFPGELKNKNLQSLGNEEHENDKHGVFVFGNDVQKKDNFDESSFLSFNENMVPGVFNFGSGINISTCSSKSSSFGASECSFSKLPDKMEKLNLQNSAYPFPDTTPSVFVSASSSKNALFGQTSSGLHEGDFSKFPGELKNQNSQSSEYRGHGSDDLGVFVFGSNVLEKTTSDNSSSLNFDYSSTFKLHDEIRKLKLTSPDERVDSQKSKTGRACKQHFNTSSFVPSNSTSLFGREDFCSRVVPLQAHNSRGLSAETTSSPSSVPGFQSSGSGFSFTSMHTMSEAPRMEFRSQKQDTSKLTKENLFAEPPKNINFGIKKDDPKGLRLKKKSGKQRQFTPHSNTGKQLAHEDKGLDENGEQDSNGGYSPMDYSPYQETLVTDQYSREASADETIHFDSSCTSKEAQGSGSVDGKEGELCSGSGDGQKGELFSTAEHFSSNGGVLKNEASDCGYFHFSSEYFRANEEISGPRKENLASKDETFHPAILRKSSSVESESFSYDSSAKHTVYEGSSGFTTTTNLDNAAQSNIMFAASSHVQDPPASRRIFRRKSRVEGGQDLHPNTKEPLTFFPSYTFPFPNAYVPTGPNQERKGNANGEWAAKVNGEKTIQDSAAGVNAEEACEKWRLRGNQAYAEGELSKAEDYYSRGLESFPLKEVSKICSRALMLCYSNRAATRMSLGRLREALRDCKKAISIDPSFLRALVRAGNIYLSLGEPADALKHFEKVLQLDEAKSDHKILLEVVDGLEKAQKLNDLMDESSIFLTKTTLDEATKALKLISEALSFSPFSEILLEMKAEVLVKLRNFEEAIQICEQTLEMAEKNAVVTDSFCQSKDDNETSHVRLWRWRVISKSYFYLGKLEEAKDLIKKHEKVKPVIDKYWSKHPETSASFPVTVCELLRLKVAGNEAFQAGKHLEAVELYTAALTLNTESHPFTAICFCNRAAAYQALGQISDAIADCSLAIALDSSYRKAISRRATLHEIIRDYEQAATDLRKLTSLLEMSSEDKSSASGMLGRSSSSISDLNQVRMRLCAVEEDAQKGGTLDLYMILGIERSCSAADVRKAYRKAALRHHPDKAGQFLARNENGDDRVWKEVAEEVHTNADRLFKMIGEAYTILVDPSKRSKYDAELDLRSARKSCATSAGNSSSRTPAASHGSQFERSADPCQRHFYESTHRRWTESSWSSR